MLSEIGSIIKYSLSKLFKESGIKTALIAPPYDPRFIKVMELPITVVQLTRK